MLLVSEEKVKFQTQSSLAEIVEDQPVATCVFLLPQAKFDFKDSSIHPK